MGKFLKTYPLTELFLAALFFAFAFNFTPFAQAQTVPAAPTNLSVTNPNNSISSLHLEWQDNSTDETEFRIYRSFYYGDNNFFSPIVITVPVSNGNTTGIFTYDNFNLDAGTDYQYKVSACNAAGCSSPSNIANATTSGSRPLRSFAIETRSACAIDLRWFYTGGPVDYYQLIRGTSSYPTRTSCGTGAASIPYTGQTNYYSYTDQNLNPNTTYYYEIRTCTGNTGGSWIQPLPTNVRTSGFSPPPAPTNLWGFADNNNERITLNWQSPFSSSSNSNARFEIRRAESTDNGTNFTPYIVIATTSPTVDFYVDLDGNGNGTIEEGEHLDSNKVYRYQVLAYEEQLGCATRRESAVLTVVIPTRPNDFRGTYTYLGGGSDRVDLWWTISGSVMNNVNVELWRKESVSGSFIKIYPTSTQQVTCSITNRTCQDLTDLNDNTDYYYRLRNCYNNGQGCSDWSNTARVPVASSPRNLESRILYVDPNSGAGSIYLSWDDTFPNDNYEIKREQFSGSNFIASTTFNNYWERDGQGGVRFYDDGRYLPPTRPRLGYSYVYSVRAIRSGGYSSQYSNEASSSLSIGKVLRGQAWANINGHGVGWINFNSADYQGGVNYSVQIDRNTGLFSGAAWASVNGGHGWGWLSFNTADLVNCPNENNPLDPPGPTGTRCAAWLASDGSVHGWGRFIGASDDSNWSGWLSLRDLPSSHGQGKAIDGKAFARLIKNFDLAGIFKYGANLLANVFNNTFAQTFVPSYGVRYDDTSREFRGEAWGDELLGWTVFTQPTNQSSPGCPPNAQCRVYAETGGPNHPPTVSNVRITAPRYNWCLQYPTYSISWQYSDPDNDPQAGARIEFLRGDNPNQIDATFVRNGSVTTLLFSNPMGYNYESGNYETNSSNTLALNTSYRVRARVWDSQGAQSDWSAPSPTGEDTTTTPPYYYPFVQFSWYPSQFGTNQDVQFTDETINRSGNPPILPLVRRWSFVNGSPSSSISSPQTVRFTRLPTSGTEPPNVILSVENSGHPETRCTLAETLTGSGGTTSTSSLRRRIFRER